MGKRASIEVLLQAFFPMGMASMGMPVVVTTIPGETEIDGDEEEEDPHAEAEQE